MKKITNPSDTVLIDPNEPLILPDGTALVGRIEWFLYALCCLDYQNLPTPMSRIEEFANALITGEIPNIEPQSRAEQFFLAILDGNISDLPQPQSRSEVLLDKLARGEFDLSDVEPIQSRYELLLAYLIKNGGIGNIDYVLYEFSEKMKTMYNTIEKPFKSLELSGNTLVNCVLEDTENDDYTSFDKDYSGTSFTINGTSEGVIKSAILSGNTLVNLSNPTNEVWRSNAINAMSKHFNIINTVVGDKYTILIFDYSEKVKKFRLSEDNGVNRQFEPQSIKPLAFNCTINNNKMYLYLYADDGVELTTDDVENVKMVILKGDFTNQDIPYFEGMQSVKMPVLTTTGKNLFDVSKLEGLHEDIEMIPNGVRVKNMQIDITRCFTTPFKENTQYTASFKHTQIEGEGREGFRFYYTDGTSSYIIPVSNSSCIGSSLPNKTIESISLSFNNVGTSELTYIQFEEGSTATSYEPYKTNILTVNEDIELRGIGDVQDTLDLMTGEVVERVGEVVLDGSENSGVVGGNKFYTNIVSASVERNSRINVLLTDKLRSDSWLNVFANTSNIYDVFGVHDNGNIEIKKQDITTVEEWKALLTSNPITVQYQLATESVKTVDLNVVDQNNTKIDKIHVFDEVTHVNATSDELTPTVNIGKSVSYPTIIKPNTKYTVDLKRNDKPLTVNLGGTEVTFASGETRKVITTPSTLTNDKLSYYGIGAKCNEIMLIEGEVERNVDYFTGMQSVVMQNQMPILSTVGKNLFDLTNAPNGYLTTNNPYALASPDHNNKTSAYIKVKPNTKYSYSFDGFTPSQVGNMYWTGFYYYKRIGEVSTAHPSRMTFTSNSEANKQITFTTPSDCNYIRIGSRGLMLDGATVQLEEATSATTYEQHKSSILSCNEDVTLRGIGDVRDTLDGNTGELTQRIGEVVLDGNQNFIAWGSYGFYISDSTLTSSSTVQCINNKYPSYTNASELSKATGNGIAVNNSRLYIKINEVTSVNEFVAYLKSNPITVQYQLATESVKTVDLNVVDQDGNTIPKVKSHNGTTHLEVTVPKQSLLPNISAEVATDNSKDMSSLTVKHQEISETQSAIEDNIQSQSDEIDKAMMATTEIFESILE